MHKRLTGNIVAWGLCGIVLVAATGCSNQDKEREAKRDEDRLAIRLAAAERDNDDYRGKLEQTQADLKAAQQRATDAEAQLAQTSVKLRDMQDQLAAGKAGTPAKQASATDPPGDSGGAGAMHSAAAPTTAPAQ